MKHPNPEALQDARAKLSRVMDDPELERAWREQVSREASAHLIEQRRIRYEKSAAEWLDYLAEMVDRHGTYSVLRCAAWMEREGNLPPGWAEWMDELCATA